MTDKYTLQQLEHTPYLYDAPLFVLYKRVNPIAKIYCSQEIANLIDNALNQTSRAGSKTSPAKREASKKNIAKRWETKHIKPDDMPEIKT